MYYTGLDPATLKPVYVTTNPHEKAMQRALIQYRNPKNYDLVHEALVKAGREDLIGFDKKCLIKPRKMHTDGGWDKKLLSLIKFKQQLWQWQECRCKEKLEKCNRAREKRKRK